MRIYLKDSRKAKMEQETKRKWTLNMQIPISNLSWSLLYFTLFLLLQLSLYQNIFHINSKSVSKSQSQLYNHIQNLYKLTKRCTPTHGTSSIQSSKCSKKRSAKKRVFCPVTKNTPPPHITNNSARTSTIPIPTMSCPKTSNKTKKTLTRIRLKRPTSNRMPNPCLIAFSLDMNLSSYKMTEAERRVKSMEILLFALKLKILSSRSGPIVKFLSTQTYSSLSHISVLLYLQFTLFT